MRNTHKAALLGLLLTIIMGLSFQCSVYLPADDADTNHCTGIHMYPSYLRLTGLDSTHSRLATKYQLYLYREQKEPPQANLDSLHGVPVLFVPGNAGSYKQARSIAAELAYNEAKGVQFDVFTAHFNEDFTAFHGRTLLDQAEYLNDAISFILSLYSTRHNPVAPQSVIIIGHSMGGIVSRVMLTLPNYKENSINTILTLAAPHAAAPATFDGDIMSIYASTDKFWRSAYFDDVDTLADQRLGNVSLVSITGGALDQILPADYTTHRGILPMSNGFTVYTTTIPEVWTPIDHLAIVWCDQLRKKISRSLYEVVDINSPSKTRSLPERMSAFRRIYLSGLEPYSQNFVNTTLNIKKSEIGAPNDRYLKTPINESFAMLTNKKSTIYACNSLSNESESTGLYNCIEIPLIILPNSSSSENSVFDSSSSGRLSPFHGIALDSSTLKNYNYIIHEPKDSLTIYSSKSSRDITSSIFELVYGVSIPLGQGSLVTDLSIKNAWTSLLVYKLTTNLPSDTHAFMPFIRQYISDPFESKWHLQLQKTKFLSFHGVAPYTPFVSKNNLHLEVWKPENSEMSIELSIDLFRSLKLLLLKYRLVIASFPISVITMVLFIQFRALFLNGNFPDFEEALNMLCSNTPAAIATLSFLSILASNPIFKYIFYLLDPIAKNNPLKLPEIHLNPYLMGIEEKFLFLIAPLFYLIAIFLVYTVYQVVRVVLFVVVKAQLSLTFASRVKCKISIVSKGEQLKSQKRILGVVLLSIFVCFYVPFQFAVIICTMTQISITIRSFLKAQEMLTISQYKQLPDGKFKNPTKVNFSNYNVSILILMLWMIPVNMPILIVFFHNVAIRWRTPFTSHHNILAILPIILLISNHVRHEEKFLELLISPTPNFKNSKTDTLVFKKYVTLFLLGWFSWFSLLYGVRSLYYIHYIFNLFSVWLVASTFWSG